MQLCISLLSSGLRGFDTNQQVSKVRADRMYTLGYKFALRYIPRDHYRAGDLVSDELGALLDSGISVMPVQHVAPGEWLPTEEIGRSYGRMAGQYCDKLGIPYGCNVWLDLESVDKKATKAAVIAYCNVWHEEVANCGYKPGVYVGWQPGLSADDLYSRLRFQSYWAAYNLNKDQYPAKRSVMMQQTVGGNVAGLNIQIDIVSPDAFGDLPLAASSLKVLS